MKERKRENYSTQMQISSAYGKELLDGFSDVQPNNNDFVARKSRHCAPNVTRKRKTEAIRLSPRKEDKQKCSFEHHHEDDIYVKFLEGTKIWKCAGQCHQTIRDKVKLETPTPPNDIVFAVKEAFLRKNESSELIMTVKKTDRHYHIKKKCIKKHKDKHLHICHHIYAKLTCEHKRLIKRALGLQKI